MDMEKDLKKFLEELLAEGAGEKTGKETCIQDLIPDFDIAHGMYIVREKGRKRYLKMVEVTATNFTLKEPSEQNHIISVFEGWLRLSPRKCQLKVITETDFSIPFLENLKEKAALCDHPVKRKFYEANIDFIKEKVERYPISKGLKLKLYDKLDELEQEETADAGENKEGENGQETKGSDEEHNK